MKNKILFLICIVLISVYLMSFLKKETRFYYEEEPKVKILLSDNEIINLNLEDYVIGVVAAEMPALYEIEALKAQAIASRTYALYKINSNHSQPFDLSASINNQAYITKDEMYQKWQDKYEVYYERIKDAVIGTKGLVMKNNNEVICAYYFALSNGMTEDSKTVFGTSLDYITPVDSQYDKEVKNYEYTIKMAKEEFCNKLGISCNKITISNITRNNTNHVDYININNQVYSGIDIRKKLNLRSTDFVIKVDDDILITTYGYGHGVGMSQGGANELAKRGQDYQRILHYFYQNITIEPV